MIDPSDVPLESLAPYTMANGRQALLLTERVGWSDFPRYAERVLIILGGTLIESADSVAERVRSVAIGGRSYWLAFDDFPFEVTLAPQDQHAEAGLLDIEARLRTFQANGATG